MQRGLITPIFSIGFCECGDDIRRQQTADFEHFGGRFSRQSLVSATTTDESKGVLFQRLTQVGEPILEHDSGLSLFAADFTLLAWFDRAFR
jgi:hypothetical protein